MLERIRIQNFQKHERLQIDFDPAVTTIVGPTDAGKSAVIRALRWTVLNQPSGEAFVRDGSDGTAVRLSVDGRDVVRRRGGSRNEYRLDDGEYKAFGADVPKPVADVLMMGPINFAAQLDSPFWLSETPGEVSRQLNAIVDLDIIDDALSAVASNVRKTQTVADVCKDRLRNAQEKTQGLEWVPKATLAFAEVYRLESATASAKASTSSIRRLVSGMEEHARNLMKATTAATAGFDTIAKMRALLSVSKDKNRLRGLISVCTRLAADATKMPNVKRLDELYESWSETWTRCDNLHYDLGELRVAARCVDDCKLTLRDADNELEAATEGLCPICGSKME